MLLVEPATAESGLIVALASALRVRVAERDAPFAVGPGSDSLADAVTDTGSKLVTPASNDTPTVTDVLDDTPNADVPTHVTT